MLSYHRILQNAVVGVVKGIVRFTGLQSLKNIIKRDCDFVLLCVIIGGVGRKYVYKT